MPATVASRPSTLERCQDLQAELDAANSEHFERAAEDGADGPALRLPTACFEALANRHGLYTHVVFDGTQLGMASGRGIRIIAFSSTDAGADPEVMMAEYAPDPCEESDLTLYVPLESASALV